MSNFHPLEVVGRGSETQLQVGENLNKVGYRLLIRVNTLCHHFYRHIWRMYILKVNLLLYNNH